MKKYIAVFKVPDSYEPEKTIISNWFVGDNGSRSFTVPLEEERGEYWIYEYTERSDYGKYFICPKCGGLSKDKTKYCPDCGRRILPFEEGELT